MRKMTILGSGMAGLGAAHRLHGLGIGSLIYEQHAYPGGHTASWDFGNGFVFDEGPHVSFTKDKRIQNLFAESVDHEYQTVNYHVNNYWRGHWIKHPAHCNLYGLPPDLVVDILKDFIHVQQNGQAEIKNYKDWLIQSYGEKFAATFPMEYTLKYHTTSAENMTTDWLGPRMYRPKLEEVLFGSLSPATQNVHYVTEFRYPSRNGFASYLKKFMKQTEIKLGYQVVKVDTSLKVLQFANGTSVGYEGLVSSVPLPELVPMIVGVPSEVLAASKALACSSCVIVNVGVDRDDLSEGHITYFYDRDIIFTRLNFPHMMSRQNVPPRCGSIQAEVYYSNKYLPLNRSPQECIEPVIADLRKCGYVREHDRILFTHAMVCRYANIIFDHDRAGALAIVHGYLDDVGIAYCGRYGDWAYTWTDEAFISGENAAQKGLDRNSR